MKKTPFLLLCLAAFYLAACAGDEPSQTPRSSSQTGNQTQEGDDEPIDKKPRLGMSTRQITAMYGEPNNIHHSAHGEVWQYWFNRGQMFIPYNFGYKPRMGTFTFNASGILTDFEYNE